MISLALALALFAQAQDPWREYNCDDPQNQAEMNRCAGLRFERADAELNRVYREAVRQEQAADREETGYGDMHPTYEEALRAAQRAWVAFRDAQCEYESFEARGGSMQPMLYEGCRARMTQERTRELSADPAN
ncbi:MAG TPA: lysozyme inhibitor LprI family protein [Allosphingosinicella sp.]|jgi:uncharacterized protein YecT (DUF1311 family)|nr:lysozyme inhibitor LprI family protein [Allosphingosinicella sp.]